MKEFISLNIINYHVLLNKKNDKTYSLVESPNGDL